MRSENYVDLLELDGCVDFFVASSVPLGTLVYMHSVCGGWFAAVPETPLLVGKLSTLQEGALKSSVPRLTLRWVVK